MRPGRLVLAALVGAASFATPAHAQQTCWTAAVPPHFVPTDAAIEATGLFGCATIRDAASVTVCIEEQLGGVLGSTWYTNGCASDVRLEDRPYIDATVAIQIPLASTFFRAVVTGTTQSGVTYSSKSAPVLWVNCACYP